MKIWPEPLHFDWDEGNRNKNWIKHKVTNEECEEAFFDPRKRLIEETFHSGKERRYLLVGRTFRGRALFIVFVLREKSVRVISARDLNKKERKLL